MPRSTPRVGSSSRMMSASAASARAITTFCWLPPLSEVTGAAPLGARIFSCRNHCAAIGLQLLERDEAPARSAGSQLEMAMFSSIDQSGKMPSATRSPETNATVPATSIVPVAAVPATRRSTRRTWRWPLPSSPARPTISPRPTSRMTPRRVKSLHVRQPDQRLVFAARRSSPRFSAVSAWAAAEQLASGRTVRCCWRRRSRRSRRSA